MLDEVHDPACRDRPEDAESEDESAETDHELRLRTLGYAEDDRQAECEDQQGAEVAELTMESTKGQSLTLNAYQKPDCEAYIT